MSTPSEPVPSNSLPEVPTLPGVPQPGEVLAGKYRVERVLGIGGMGVVVAAMHLELDERVAVKFLAPNMPAQPDAIARFVREAKAAIKIRSDHVVRVLDSGKLDSGAPYIVMEYLDGLDLHAVLEAEGPLSVDLAVDYVIQACDAIGAAHALGIIHRDLKPGNLFLTKRSDGSGLVKVLDFGISKVMSGSAISAPAGLTTTTTIMGTPAFMSPEQLRSTRHVDARADIWSMGTILFALLTGEPPYAGESTADIAAKIIRDPPPPLRALRPDAPEGLEQVIACCLEKDPDARYSGIAELAEALLPFAPPGARASAERLAKQISTRQLGAAATLPSTRPPAFSTPGPRTNSSATRTASAWGEAKIEERAPKRGRSFVALVTVGAAVIVGATVALVMPRGEMHGIPMPSGAHAAAAPATALPESRPTPAIIALPTSGTAPAPSQSAAPLASASAAPSVKPPSIGGATTPAMASTPRSGARHGTSPAAKGSPAAPGSPAPPAASSSTGLFDDRE
jgi:serine/threonine protein kinase